MSPAIRAPRPVLLFTLLALTAAPAAFAQSVVLTATPAEFVEATVDSITLDAQFMGVADAHVWEQLSGPAVPITDLGPTQALLDVRDVEVAADTELTFRLSVTIGAVNDVGTVSVVARAAEMVSPLGEDVQIGGATTAVLRFKHDGAAWVLFNFGNRLVATTAGGVPGETYSVHLAGFIHDVLVVTYEKKRYAIAALGAEGIAVVDLQDPTAMALSFQIGVNYFQDGLAWSEGGGGILVDQVISGTRGTIRALATNGKVLWIGNADYGIHRTSLSNLLAKTGPVLEDDGTLKIDHERYTLQYAGEVPWGGPMDLKLYEGRLFAVLEFLGLGIYDRISLKRVGRYNLYTDVSMVEDWFIDLDPAQAVQPGFLDPDTGMPDYRQASFEILDSHGEGSGAATPWADFDRYGKYYYHSRAVDVATYDGRTIAYIAYGLGGLVAVKVTGFEEATPKKPIEGKFLACLPAVPAHGPDEFIGTHSDSIFPHFGFGMLQEAGVVDVALHKNRVVFTDHFAGLVIVDGARDPKKSWKGPAAPYDNDDGTPGDHVPDYEFVTSFDMSPYDPTDHESLPAWMYEAPARLTTGEVGGHGGAFALVPKPTFFDEGVPDVLMGAGAGGFGMLDVVDLDAQDVADRFVTRSWFPSTDEVGAAADGSSTEIISVGHSQGLDVSEDYLYLADGPHGVSVWKLVDDVGQPLDAPRLVANTVQDEYPVEVGSTTVYPATHAAEVVYDPITRSILVLCQSVGLRRIDVGAIEDGLGVPGAPLLIGPQPTDIFEHSGEGAVKIPSVPKQDHAYDVVVDGNLAYVADGGNGLTIYDLTKDPTVVDSGFFVSNLGGASQNKPLLGRATGIALWTDPMGGKRYAIMASGQFGVGVVDVDDPAAPVLVKVFEPIKLEIEDEEVHVGKADGRCVDVWIDGDHAWFTYDSFGVLCFALADLVEPLPMGVDPTDIWQSEGPTVIFDYRPETISEFRLRDLEEFVELGGGALGMTATVVGAEVTLYVAYGDAGVLVLDGSDPAAPAMKVLLPTTGECADVAVAHGRIYAADNAGGLAVFE